MAFNMTYLFADTIPPDVDVVAAAAVAPTERIPYVLDVLKNVGKLGGRAFLMLILQNITNVFCCAVCAERFVAS